jgi:NAD(P)-dependent dehydrogenase (short-subunit alcohol dehydrogenase family)
MNDLNGKVALVTGTGQGIGREIALVLCEMGATVVGASLPQEAPNSKNEIDAALFISRQVDVTDRLAVHELLHFIKLEFNLLDILVNNAGNHPPQGSISGVSDPQFRALLELNVVAPFGLIRDCLPMLRASSGSVVNIGSFSGAFGQDGSAAYCATKGALASMTKAMAVDEGVHNVRFNCVSPGAIESPATTLEHSQHMQKEIASWSSLGRMGSMREVANVVAFLCGPLSGYVTGQDILVTGGSEIGFGVRAVHTIKDRDE